MRKAVCLLFLLQSSLLIYAQEQEYTCLFTDSASAKNLTDLQKSQIDSENGWYLSTTGTIRVLVVFVEIDNPGDPGNSTWMDGQLPVWANDLLDNTVIANPQGELSRFYHEASSGNLNVIGDYLVAPTNNGVIELPAGSSPSVNSTLINTINSQMNGNFITSSGGTNPLVYDNWTKTGSGLPKITPSQDSPAKYDHVMYLFRNGLGAGTGSASPGGHSPLLLGYAADTYSRAGAGDGIPTKICEHEFNHLLLGNNSFHTCGGGSQLANYWIPTTGGHAMMGLAGSALQTWNGWDRHRLGWKAPGNTHLISARTAWGAEVNGDIDAANPADAGFYVLRDFATTGDAIRIKLPFINSETEYQQYIWLENHRSAQNNGSIFDVFYHQNSTTCVEGIEWGLSLQLQIDRDTKTGPSTYSGHGDYIRQLSAFGMWEYAFDDNIQLDACTGPLGWGNQHYPGERIRENPLSGFSDLDATPYDFNGNGNLIQSDQKAVSAERENGVVNWKLYNNGNPRQLMRTSDVSELGISTNPTLFNRLNLVGRDLPESGSAILNNRTVYVNGIKIEIVDMLSNGDIRLQIDFDQTDITQNVRWAAPSIVLNEITGVSGYSLNVTLGKSLTIDHGTAATRMDNPIYFEGQQVFTGPTVFEVKENATVNIESYADMIIDRNSEMILRSGSELNIEDLGRLVIKRGGKLIIESNALLNIENSGSLIIEPSDGNYSRGSLVYKENARINLEGPEAIIDCSGEIRIDDNASFTLANSTNAFRTYGKLIFRDVPEAEITSGLTTELGFLGYSRNQEVLIQEKTIILPVEIERFVAQDLTISQGPNASLKTIIASSGDLDFINARFRSISLDGSGIHIYGHQDVTINNCLFENLHRGIYSNSNFLGFGFWVVNSVFDNVQIGITTIGEDLHLRDTEFNGGEINWEGLDMTGTSSMKDVEMDASSVQAIQFQGNASLLAEYCIINNGQDGILLDKSIHKIRCSEIRNHDGYGFTVANSAELIMNGNWDRNTCDQNDETIILNDASVLNLNNGFNDLRSASPVASLINGNLICHGSTTLQANQNVWNNQSVGPDPQDYALTDECNGQIIPMTILDNNPQSTIPDCSSGISGEGGGIKSPEEDYAKSENYLQFLDVYEAVQNTGFDDYLLNFVPDQESDQSIEANAQALLEIENIGTIVSNCINSEENELIIDEPTLLINYMHVFDESISRIAYLSKLSESELLDTQTRMEIESFYILVRAYLNNIDFNSSAFYSQVAYVNYLRQFETSEAAINQLAEISLEDAEENEHMVYNRLSCHLNLENQNSTFSYEEYLDFMQDCLNSSGSIAPLINNESTSEFNNESIMDYTISPNPAEDMINVTIQTDYSGPFTYRIIDALGKKHIDGTTSESNLFLDVADLPSGLFIIQIGQVSHIISKKFLVAH